VRRETLFDYHIGLGIGIEVGQPNKGINGSIELPFTLFLRENKGDAFLPIPGVSLIYYFEAK